MRREIRRERDKEQWRRNTQVCVYLNEIGLGRPINLVFNVARFM